ncbi:MAG: hypothetical protein GXP62_01140 [Oligoflexia bacterium]|nr:hypothetical protein [Oligoflexia bacterium]
MTQPRQPLHPFDLSEIDSIAVDEMFSQDRPVLAGIDLDTQVLFQPEVHDNRSGETWTKSLGKLRDRQGLSPKRVVKDAGTGNRAEGLGRYLDGLAARLQAVTEEAAGCRPAPPNSEGGQVNPARS